MTTSEYAAPDFLSNFAPARIALETGETDSQGGPVIKTLFDKTRAIAVPPNTGVGELGGLFIYSGETPTRKIETVFALDPYATYENDGTHYIFVSALDGKRYHLYRESGCGCGNPVKRMAMPPLRYLNITDPESVRH